MMVKSVFLLVCYMNGKALESINIDSALAGGGFKNRTV